MFLRNIYWLVISIGLTLTTAAMSGDEPKPSASDDAVKPREKLVDPSVLRAQLRQWRTEVTIPAILEQRTDIEFVETPLADVVEFLKDKHDIEIELDTRLLDVVGIGSDNPITKELKDVSLRFALRAILRELELTYIIDEEVLMITTPEEADSTKVFLIGDLAEDKDARHELKRVVQVATGIEEDRIAVFRDRLIVVGTVDAHQEVEKLLTAIRGRPVQRLRDMRHPLERWQFDKRTDLSGLIRRGDLQYLKGQSQIESLDVSSTNIDDTDVALISDLPNLQVLKLAGTHVTDVGLAHLKHVKKLETLDLRETDVTVDGLKKIEELKSLKHLSVGSTQRDKSSISKTAVGALQKSLPDCKITAYYFRPKPMGAAPARPVDDPFGGDPFGGGGADPFGENPFRDPDPFGGGKDDPFREAPAKADKDLKLGSLLKEFEENEGRFLRIVEEEKAAKSREFRTRIETELRDITQKKIMRDPEGAIAELKILLDRVERESDLDSSFRLDLRKQIEAVISEMVQRVKDKRELSDPFQNGSARALMREFEEGESRFLRLVDSPSIACRGTRLEVDSAIADLNMSDSKTAVVELNLLLEMVARSEDLDNDVRKKLNSRIESSIANAKRRAKD